MTVRANIPAIPGAGDLWALSRFLDNRKEFDKWMKQIAEATTKHLEVVALHGKAEDIERIHTEAKAWEVRAVQMFETRQKATEKGETDLKAAQEAFRQAQAQEKSALESYKRDAVNALKARERAVKEQEERATEREAVADRRETEAVTARQEAQAIKAEYEKKLAKIREVAA